MIGEVLPSVHVAPWCITTGFLFCIIWKPFFADKTKISEPNLNSFKHVWKKYISKISLIW